LGDAITRPARPGHRDERVDPVRHGCQNSQVTISQEELDALQALDRRRRELEADYAARRRSILARLVSGGAIEPGQWNALRVESNQCRATLADLERLYGADFIRDLRARLAPKKQVYLRLVATRKERPAGAGALRPKPSR
jgi:hypothetical protein